MKLPIIWHNERRSVESLKEHPQNPRIHTTKGVEALRKSIERNGFIDPIAINTDGMILSGHARKKTLLAIGISEVDVRVPDRELTDSEQRAVIVELNKAIAGEWDFDTLSSAFEISELKDFNFTDLDLGIFAPVEKNEEERLDIKKTVLVTCPNCQHEFTS